MAIQAAQCACLGMEARTSPDPPGKRQCARRDKQHNPAKDPEWAGSIQHIFCTNG